MRILWKLKKLDHLLIVLLWYDKELPSNLSSFFQFANLKKCQFAMFTKLWNYLKSRIESSFTSYEKNVNWQLLSLCNYFSSLYICFKGKGVFNRQLIIKNNHNNESLKQVSIIKKSIVTHVCLSAILRKASQVICFDVL